MSKLNETLKWIAVTVVFLTVWSAIVKGYAIDSCFRENDNTVIVHPNVSDMEYYCKK